ncbi:hypothetical protein DH2020_005134 [Rehmannia glutinosa]|uniref:Splicing factor cactin central domain-containing protein n=1 Tax=Rehmannia glutinosa TaxID=99300 RepID=A0ABR0XRN5_REHGL
MTSSSRRRRHHSSDDSSSDSASDSHRRRSRSRSSRRKSDSDSDEQAKRRSKRKVTEEEIAEYLAKKAHKKAMKVAKKLKAQTVSGYSNDSNPFGDSNLNEKFVWRKKIERDVTQGVPLDEFSIKAEKKRQRERMAEIEKVKKRREERAIEKAQHEEEMRFDSREGRTKPIDILTKHLDPSDDIEIEINEPYMVFKGLTVKEMEELHNDIKMHLDLDRATPTHIKYWEEKDASERARVRGEQLPPEMIGEERGLHASIEADVKSLLQGKTYSELEVLQSQIESQMRSGTAKVVEYWEAVLKRLHIYKAKACLKEIHAKMLRKHLERLETPSEGENDETELAQEPDQKDSDPDVQGMNRLKSFVFPFLDLWTLNSGLTVLVYKGSVLSPIPEMDVEVHDEEELAGSYSPQLLHGDENEEEDAIDPEVDKAILERRRIAVLEERRIQELSSRPAPPEDNFEKTAMKAMGTVEEGDVVFGSNDEINLDSQVD